MGTRLECVDTYVKAMLLSPYHSDFWRPLLKSLPGGKAYACPDLSICDDMVELADAILVEAPAKFLQIAFCMGGYLALEMMRQAPERIAGLVLISSSSDSDSPAERAIRKARIAKLAAKACSGSHHPKSHVENAVTWLTGVRGGDTCVREAAKNAVTSITPAMGSRQQSAMMSRRDNTAVLAKISVPTLLICGRNDRVVSWKTMARMQEMIQGSELHILEQCGHLAPIEAAPQTAWLIREWMIRHGFWRDGMWA